MDEFINFVKAQNRITSALDVFNLPPPPILPPAAIDYGRFAFDYNDPDIQGSTTNGSFSEMFNKDYTPKDPVFEFFAPFTIDNLKCAEAAKIDLDNAKYYLEQRSLVMVGRGKPFGWHCEGSGKNCAGAFDIRFLQCNEAPTAIGNLQAMLAAKPDSIRVDDFLTLAAATFEWVWEEDARTALRCVSNQLPHISCDRLVGLIDEMKAARDIVLNNYSIPDHHCRQVMTYVHPHAPAYIGPREQPGENVARHLLVMDIRSNKQVASARGPS